MATPQYKGPGQPTPTAPDGITGLLGGFLGGPVAPAYKTPATATPAPPAPPPTPPPACAPCAPCPDPAKAPPLVQQHGVVCAAEPFPPALDECGDAVIPVGRGPITIVIHPRA